MMSGSNIHFEMAERGRALNYGGIGAIHPEGCPQNRARGGIGNAVIESHILRLQRRQV
jgi:hypothetical protein